MSILSAWVAVAAALMIPVQQPQPDVTIYRSWRPPNLTLVEGMFRVDPELLGTSDCAYGVRLAVRDAQGTELLKDEWTGSCPVADGVQVAGLETFRFHVVPATYSVTIDVYPQGRPDRAVTRTLEVEALSEDPLVSDLILGREVGLIGADTGAWSMRRGGVGIQAASQIVIRTEDPKFGYYLELYPEEGEPMTGTVVGVVRRRDGRELTRFSMQQLQALAQPGPIAGMVPVEGLPPGAYTFEAHIQLGDTTVVRAHPFFVASTAVATAEGRGWFWTLSDQELTETFDPVVVWLTASEAQLYRTLPPDGKREFLSQQFGRGGPTPDDGDESALDAFIARSRVVRERYAERAGRGQRDPWATDRGRIYLLRGQPTQVASRPSPQSGAPYELWVYSGGQNLAYLFVDDTRMGHFRLIYSNDPAETAFPGWEQMVGAEAIEDLARAGVRPRSN